MLETEPSIFTFFRDTDETGNSGTGRVLDGVVFHNGKTIVVWRTDVNYRSLHGNSSVSVYDSFEEFKEIHISSHSNQDEIVWLYNEPNLT